MNDEKVIFLPGLNKQLKLLIGNQKIEGAKILVIGSSSEQVAMRLAKRSKNRVDLIVEDYDSFINSNLLVEDIEGIKVKVMDFEVTDFKNETFDIVYAQASISSERRTKIVKEINRILKPDGILSVGEVVTLNKDVPSFVQDIFEQSDLDPIYFEEIREYYENKKFEIIACEDFSNTLKAFYQNGISFMEKGMVNLSDKEKIYYKKIIKQIGHESNAYLKQGADQFIGFYSLIMRKPSN